MKTDADLIRFLCQCGKKLKAYPHVRGKIVKCPRCGKTARVPQASTRTKDEPEKVGVSRAGVPTGDESSSLYAAVRLPKASRLGSAQEAVRPLSGGKCPKCGTLTAVGDVMCTHCGLNFVTGVVLTAKVEGRKRKLS
jgi:DNA-directed RNA polymerase subunit M/transcription elongation factor TFIIS